MARIDIRNLDEETLTKLDEQMKKYGINNRADYIRLLINLDINTNIVELINRRNKNMIYYTKDLSLYFESEEDYKKYLIKEWENDWKTEKPNLKVKELKEKGLSIKHYIDYMSNFWVDRDIIVEEKEEFHLEHIKDDIYKINIDSVKKSYEGTLKEIKEIIENL